MKNQTYSISRGDSEKLADLRRFFGLYGDLLLERILEECSHYIFPLELPRHTSPVTHRFLTSESTQDKLDSVQALLACGRSVAVRTAINCVWGRLSVRFDLGSVERRARRRSQQVVLTIPQGCKPQAIEYLVRGTLFHAPEPLTFTVAKVSFKQDYYEKVVDMSAGKGLRVKHWAQQQLDSLYSTWKGEKCLEI